MRSEPKLDMPVILKSDEMNNEAKPQVMFISDIDKKNDSVTCKWISKNGEPFQCSMRTGILEKYNPKRFEK